MKQFFQTPQPVKASRRQVLGIGATLAGGALIVGCSPSMIGKAMSIGAKHDFGAFGPFIKVAQDGTVTVVSKHIELGQGNHAGLAALVAEELDADWDTIKVEQAPHCRCPMPAPRFGSSTCTWRCSAPRAIVLFWPRPCGSTSHTRPNNSSPWRRRCSEATARPSSAARTV